jgi:hypothetical protein
VDVAREGTSRKREQAQGYEDELLQNDASCQELKLDDCE